VVKGVMEGAVELTVPLPVEVKTGQRWGSMSTLRC
jgi:DNA polymerase I-like protein with 3'-5' exonuclease and polymerase domains